MESTDFIMYKKDGNILSMGYKFDNLLKKMNLPAMIGGGESKINIHNSDYGIPVGLALLNKNINNIKEDIHTKNIEGGVVKNDLYDKLLHMSEQRKKTNSKTKKYKKQKKRKTRKLK
tara:strand:- start:485 stop:835 length:351 start_codon:yes stop_codon:yes gene_type:complete